SRVPSVGHRGLFLSPAQAEIWRRGYARPKCITRDRPRSVARTEPRSVLGARGEGRRSRSSRRWEATPGLLPILRPESVSSADRAQAPSYRTSIQLETITVECGGFVPREI